MRPLGEELLSDQLGSDYTSNRDAAGMKNACCKPTWLAWYVDMFWRCAAKDLSERFLRHRGVRMMPARTEAMVYYTPWLP